MKKENLSRLVEIAEELVSIANDEGIPQNKMVDVIGMADGYMSILCDDLRITRVEGFNESVPVWTSRTDDGYIIYGNGLFEAPTGEIKFKE